jgi:hypothetical protein
VYIYVGYLKLQTFPTKEATYQLGA